MKKNLLITIALLSFLTACQSTPTQHYRLPDSGVPTQTTNTRATLIKVNIVSYLNSTAMVYQLDDVTLNFSQQNLWVQNLREGIAQSLANKLNRTQNNRFVLNDNNQNAQRTLAVTINKFYGRYDGQVAVSGFYQIINNQKIIRSEPFDYLIPQEGDGYDAMVKALDQGLDQIAQTVLYSI